MKRCAYCGTFYDTACPRCLAAEQKPKGRGRVLDSERDKSLTALQPWKHKGMSRATWYRRQGRGK